MVRGVDLTPACERSCGTMLPIPYATLEVIRTVVKNRQIISLRHKGRLQCVEPHCLALSRRHRALIIGEGRFDFFRFADICDLEVTEDT